MRIESAGMSLEVYKEDGLFGIYTAEGEVVLFDDVQASQLILVLQNAIRTGEVPE